MSTKLYLHKIKIIESPLCTSCDEPVDETITHMLWSCPETKCFLQKIKTLLHTRNIQFNLIEELYIFNIGKQYNTATLILILEIKYYIFSSKRLNTPLSMNAFKNKVSWAFKTYEHIARKNNRLDNFDREWKLIMQAFK